MKFATVLMSLILAGVFANAQGAGTEQAAPEGAKMEAPAKAEKKEKKEKKHKKHGKKEEKKTEETK